MRQRFQGLFRWMRKCVSFNSYWWWSWLEFRNNIAFHVLSRSTGTMQQNWRIFPILRQIKTMFSKTTPRVMTKQRKFTTFGPRKWGLAFVDDIIQLNTTGLFVACDQWTQGPISFPAVTIIMAAQVQMFCSLVFKDIFVFVFGASVFYRITFMQMGTLSEINMRLAPHRPIRTRHHWNAHRNVFITRQKNQSYLRRYSRTQKLMLPHQWKCYRRLTLCNLVECAKFQFHVSVTVNSKSQSHVGRK